MSSETFLINLLYDKLKLYSLSESKQKQMEWNKYIVSDKKILLGKATIKGTRISVDHLISLFAQGWSEEQILKNYPRITKESLKAVFSYIHECIQDGLLLSDTKKSA